MAPRLSKQDAQELDDLLRADPNINPTTIAELFNCIYKTIWERRKKLQERELAGNAPINPRGRPRLITPEIEDFYLWLIERDAELLLDKVTDFIYVEFDIELHSSIVSYL